MPAKTELTRADILPMPEYLKVRAAKRREIVDLKRSRRLEVGPYAAFLFESWDTMWWQVQEMLYIEKGGEAQLQGELEAYNPLIPKGDELVATVMFQIEDPVRRKVALAKLGGIEETAYLEFAGHRIAGRPEEDQDRTSAEGKASSVQFIHFAFTAEQAAAFQADGTRVVAGFTHPEYGHMTAMPDTVRAALAKDLSPT